MANDPNTGQVIRPRIVDPDRIQNADAAFRAEHSICNALGAGWGASPKGKPLNVTYNTQQPKGKRGK